MMELGQNEFSLTTSSTLWTCEAVTSQNRSSSRFHRRHRNEIRPNGPARKENDRQLPRRVQTPPKPNLTSDFGPKNDIDLTKHKNKRSLTALGNLLSYITGVPGPDDWKLNIANIDNLKKTLESIDHKVDLSNQRIDLNQNAINKLHEDLTKVIGSIEQQLTETEYLKDGLKFRLLFASITTDALKVLELIESLYHKLEMVMVMGRHHFASKFGIDPTFLTQQLRDIETNSKSGLNVRISRHGCVLMPGINVRAHQAKANRVFSLTK